MSVLQKMANGLNSEDYLFNIYNKLRLDLKKGITLKSEDYKARRIQAFLRLIKSAQLNGVSNASTSRFWPAADQISLLKQLQAINPGLFSNGLMTKTSTSSTQLGYYLEKDLYNIFQTFSHLITGKSGMLTMVEPRGGNLRTQIPDIINIGDTVMKKAYREAYQAASRGLKQYANHASESAYQDFYSRMVSVQGKIDVAGLEPATITLSNASKIHHDLAADLSNTSFTAKNYSNSSQISLGHTNPFRVFSTSAHAAGVNGGPERYFRMVNCLRYHENSPHNNAPALFYRIRAIYELTGAKMQYVKQDALSQLLSGQYARFLVVNQPGTGTVRVISTARIVQNMVNAADAIRPKSWQQAMYGPITLKYKSLNFSNI